MVGGDAGVEGGPAGRGHPPRCPAEEDVALGHVGHELGQGLGVGEVRGGGRQPRVPAGDARSLDGDAVSTRFGDVQVQITVASGKITASQVLQVPWNDHRDQEINSYAVPILNQEAVSSQSSTIDMVSGATYTSDGYIQSLQSAIAQAHL